MLAVKVYYGLKVDLMLLGSKICLLCKQKCNQYIKGVKLKCDVYFHQYQKMLTGKILKVLNMCLSSL